MARSIRDGERHAASGCMQRAAERPIRISVRLLRRTCAGDMVNGRGKKNASQNTGYSTLDYNKTDRRVAPDADFNPNLRRTSALLSTYLLFTYFSTSPLFHFSTFCVAPHPERQG